MMRDDGLFRDSSFTPRHPRDQRATFFVPKLIALLGWVLLLAACGRPEIAPVAINPEDMCSMCRMAISEKQYAAEFITTDGDAVKFDDIGCLRDFLAAKGDRSRIAAYFVVDYESKKWLKAESARLVKSAEFVTPMGGGIVAFEKDEPAQAAVARYRGELVKFADLIGKQQFSY